MKDKTKRKDFAYQIIFPLVSRSICLDEVRNNWKLNKKLIIMKRIFIILLISLLTSQFFQLRAQDSDVISTEANVIYGMHGGLALLLDIYYPSKSNGYGIIVIPGSGFHQLISYDATPLNKNPRYLTNIIGTTNLLDKGYTLFVINHRSSPIFRFPAAIEDAQRAVQFIRHNSEKYKINKEKLGAIGHSSGAHLVSMLGTMDDVRNLESNNPIDKESSKVQAVVALAGLFDLTKFAMSGFGDIGAVASFVGTHLPAWRSSDDPREYEFDLYAKASPINYITNDDASFLLVHGTNETVVHMDQSKAFYADLKGNNVEANLIIIERADHGLRIDNDAATEKYYDSTIEIFDMKIRNK